MTNAPDQLARLSPQRLQLLALELQDRLRAHERADHEPIAVIGMACRFPGAAHSPEAFWANLERGLDAIVPIDRWDTAAIYDPEPGVAGKAYGRHAGLLDNIDGFDPTLFELSLREAARMDPQQRLLLEVAWEALERGGLSPRALRDSATGVFVGLCNADYARLASRDPGYLGIDAHTVAGCAPATAAGRLSYVLGLRGPAFVVDTACSSSLVALHQACMSLRRRESRLALVGGANVILSPETQIGLCQARMISPTGRCHTFDAAADGYVRGEGCAVVVLKRLSDAIADGDPIDAVIRGSAVNQDGRSSGLTAPSMVAQRDVIRAALADAELDPTAISYVEAHGTGTRLGDPIEIEALKEVFGAASEPLWVGSVKSCIGHLEAAAGIAGLIKTILALHHRRLPGQLHFHQLNPEISLAESRLRISDVAQPWDSSGPRRAGVSSFGFSGTNAHVVVEEAPVRPAAAREPESRTSHVLAISARSESAARQLASSYVALARTGTVEAGDLCAAAATRAQLPEHRIAVAGSSAQALADRLELRVQDVPGRAATRSVSGAPRVAFAFTGQGSQYVGMTRGLYRGSARYRALLDRCDALAAPYLPRSLLSVVFGDDEALLTRTEFTQPALFAVEWALAELWRALGVEPHAVIGHSIGEIAAAAVAGAIDVADGIRLACARGRLIGELPAGGAMAEIAAELERVAPQVAAHGEDLAIAAVNGKTQIVVSGRRGAVDQLIAQFEREGIRCRRLQVSHAFHSSLVEPALDPLEQVAREIAHAPPRIHLISNVSGAALGDRRLDAAYWRRHARAPVLFSAGAAALAELGCSHVIEVGPRPTLLSFVRELGTASTLLPSVRPPRDEWETFLGSAATLFEAGLDLRWDVLDEGRTRARVSVPLYPYQRQALWLDGLEPPSRRSEAPTYGVSWRPVPRVPTSGAPGARRWFVICDRGGVGAAFAARVSEAGFACVAIAGDDPRSLAEVCADAAAGDAIAYLRPLDAPTNDQLTLDELAAATHLGTGAVVQLAALRRTDALDALDGGPRFYTATRGAQPVGTPARVPQLAQAPLWGISKVAALELPAWGGIVDLDPDHVTSHAAAVLAAEWLAGGDARGDAAYVGDTRYELRVTPAVDAPGASACVVDADSAYLITGGLGTLGLAAAQELVSRGARHLILASRRAEPDAAARLAIAALEAAGAEVTLRALDVSDPARVAALFEELAGSRRLAGIVHAAGVARIAPLAELDAVALAADLSAKVRGTLVLDQLARGRKLDWICYPSSIASVWGSLGLGAYAAANAFLDAMAHRQRAEGTHAASVHFGPLDGGMIDQSAAQALQRIGIDLLATAAAGRALLDAPARGAELVVARVDWLQLRAALDLRGRGGVLDEVAKGPAGAPRAGGESELRRELAALPADERRGALAEMLRAHCASVLGTTPAAVDPERGLFAMGFDSLMAVELIKRLDSALGVALPRTVVFEQPTITALVDYLADKIGATQVTVRAAAVTASQPYAASEPIAIVGVACRFPGDVSDPEAFWRLLERGGDAIDEVPAERWKLADVYDPDPGAPGKTYTRHGGFLRDVDLFDPEAFGIAPREAIGIDPQQRLVLELAWEALERTGRDPRAMAGANAGVFVGISSNDYGHLLLRERGTAGIDAYSASGNALNVAAGRLSYVLGLQGPSMAVDTACSSSLVALHLACQSLRTGECDLAIAGGVNLLLVPDPTVAASKARMLSPDGRCKTFDERADGYVRGEGCGVVIVRRLADAARDGDPILAVVRGSAVRQDGASSGLTVPNGAAQRTLLREVYAQADIDPTEVDYVEAHGTGTALGDPIEVHALADVMQGEGRARPVILGSVKANIGHLESAAGMAGVIKAVLCLHHQAIPRQVHFRALNPHITAEAAAKVSIPTATVPWPRGPRARYAGVSSFGFSGTLAHVVLEEAPQAQPQPTGRALTQFKRRRFWSSDAATATPRPSPRSVLDAAALLGERVKLPGSRELRFERTFDLDTLSFLRDHLVFGHVVVPGSFHVAYALTAAEHALPGAAVSLHRMSFVDPLRLDEGQPIVLQAIFSPSPADPAIWDIRITSAPAADDVAEDAWSTHLTAQLHPTSTSAEPLELARARAACVQAIDATTLYQRVGAAGLALGPWFRWGDQVWQGRDEALRRVEPPAGADSPTDVLHPGMVDSCLHVLAAATVPLDRDDDGVYVPVSIERCAQHAPPRPVMWCRARARHGSIGAKDTTLVGDVELYGEGGEPIATFEGVALRRVRAETFARRIQDWCYDVGWTAAPHAPSTSPRARARWLVVADRGDLADAVERELVRRGDTVDRAARASVDDIKPRLAAHGEPVTGIVYLCPRSVDGAARPRELPAYARELAMSLLDVVRATVGVGGSRSPTLHVVTQLAQAVVPDDRVDGIAQTVAWGLTRSIRLEHPELRCTRVDLDDGPVDRLAVDLAAELRGADQADEVAWRRGARLVAKLARCRASGAPLPISRDASYLITGGTGGLGLAVARWLIEHKGARQLALLSRSGSSADRDAEVEELRRMGARVLCLRADVGDRAELARALEVIRGELAPLRGVVHAAGVLSDAVMLNATATSIDDVFRPKVDGALHLHDLLAETPLDFFVMFSGAAALLGSPGQASYSAANAFLDGLALYRRARGLPAHAIAWGAIEDRGMAARAGRSLVSGMPGVGTIPIADMLALLDVLARHPRGYTAVLPIDWSQLVQGVGLSALPAAFSAFAQGETQRPERAAAELATMSGAELEAFIHGVVAERVASVLGMTAVEQLDVDVDVLELGMDSLMAIELRNEIRDRLGISLSMARLLEGATVRSISELMVESINAMRTERP